MLNAPFTLHWFPGHMAKAKRNLHERMRQVDFVIEVADARGPRATRNPELWELIAHRPSVLVLAKRDLADESVTRAWLNHLKTEEPAVVSVSLLDSRDIHHVRQAVMRVAHQVRRGRRRGGVPRPHIPGVKMPRMAPPEIRGMVIGMPNTGKSSLIRALGGGKVATGNRPGVTRGVQELSLGGNVTLLDTPGLLWPRATTGEIALYLAWLGYAGERAYDPVEASKYLIEWLSEYHPDRLMTRYDVRVSPDDTEPEKVLDDIALRFGRSGGMDESSSAAAAILLNDFRKGLLGPLTLEHPKDDGDMTR